MLSHREKKIEGITQEKGISPTIFRIPQYNTFGQFGSLPSSNWTKLIVYLSVCSLRNHEPSEVQMDGFSEYNWTHSNPYVRKASTFSGHSYHVNILGPHEWGHQITKVALWNIKYFSHTHTHNHNAGSYKALFPCMSYFINMLFKYKCEPHLYYANLKLMNCRQTFWMASLSNWQELNYQSQYYHF